MAARYAANTAVSLSSTVKTGLLAGSHPQILSSWMSVFCCFIKKRKTNGADSEKKKKTQTEDKE